MSKKQNKSENATLDIPVALPPNNPSQENASIQIDKNELVSNSNQADLLKDNSSKANMVSANFAFDDKYQSVYRLGSFAKYLYVCSYNDACINEGNSLETNLDALCEYLYVRESK